MLLIGVDEAGYGPNLGPLTIGVTAWRVADCSDAAIDLYEVLQEAVTAKPDGKRIAIADSKQLYKPHKGWNALEIGVLSALTSIASSNQSSTTWESLAQHLSTEAKTNEPKLPWRDDFSFPLPHNANADDIAKQSQQLQATCKANHITPPTLRARCVQPAEFNRLTQQHGTKGAALSHLTIGLLREVIDSLPSDTQTVCILDKHGGRNRYGALLQHHFPEQLVQTVAESRPRSHYRWGPADNPSQIEFTFRTGGEAFLPAALASMTAKLLREIEMHAFNQFWQTHLPNLKPTAGYPLDAKRFKREIEAKQTELGIADDVLWRKR